jgi:hypothetical protein
MLIPLRRHLDKWIYSKNILLFHIYSKMYITILKRNKNEFGLFIQNAKYINKKLIFLETLEYIEKYIGFM